VKDNQATLGDAPSIDPLSNALSEQVVADNRLSSSNTRKPILAEITSSFGPGANLGDEPRERLTERVGRFFLQEVETRARSRRSARRAAAPHRGVTHGAAGPSCQPGLTVTKSHVTNRAKFMCRVRSTQSMPMPAHFSLEFERRQRQITGAHQTEDKRQITAQAFKARILSPPLAIHGLAFLFTIAS
jgi:hypothetical protein